MVEIRKAQKEDLKEIYEIEKSSFHKPFELKDLNYELLENPFSNFLVALNNDLVVGYLIFWITFDSATICRIAVKNEYRKLGIAQKMLTFCDDICKTNQVEFLTLEVRASNNPAISLYEKCGFIKVSKKEKYYEDGEDAIYMIKGEI